MSNSNKSVIRTIYLYLFALVGLGMTVVGSAMLVNILLKQYIFTYSQIDRIRYSEKPMMGFKIDTLDLDEAEELKENGECLGLSEKNIESINKWTEDYEEWSILEEERKEFEENIDYNKQNRQRETSGALSTIIIGIPLFLFHWITIVKDKRREEE